MKQGTHRLIIQVREDQRAWLKAQSDVFRPVAAIVRELIDEAMARNPEPPTA
jgi:hypothetical protein